MFTHKPDPEVVRRLDALEQRLDVLAETDGKLIREANERFTEFVKIARERLDLHSENIKRLTENLNILVADIGILRADLDAVEQKLDEVLAAQDAKARSIPTEEAKPEEANVMPGHIPWSKRKALRASGHRSQEFINRVTKSAAPTEPKQPEAKNE